MFRSLQLGQPRDDYLELLELSIIFLGSISSRGTRFRPPEAIHAARWMAKGLYCLKMSLFPSQLCLEPEEKKGLLTVRYCTVSVHLKAWFSAPDSASSPRNDLELIAKI